MATKKGKAITKKQVENSDGSGAESDAEAPTKAKASAFALLMDDSDASASNSEDMSDNEVKPVKKAPAPKKEPSKPEAKKGKKKKKDDDEEDLDKMLAELELEYKGGKPAAQAADASETAEDSKKKDKKKKKKGKEDSVEKETPAVDEAPPLQREASVEAPEEGDDAAAAAKKKKDKKKKKKAVEKDVAEVEDEDEEGDKKKKGAKDDKKDKKGPNKKIVAAMQEALRKQKEEEDRLLKEEEERIRREEELEEQRLEKERLEKEKKELKKQREKEKREQLKAEGLLLTAKQKQAQARSLASLALWEAQGIKVPGTEEKKVRPGTRVRPKKEKHDKEASPVEAELTDASAEKAEELKAPKENGLETENVVEEVADSWELLDAVEEDKPEPVPEQVKPAVEPAKPAGPKPLPAKPIDTKPAPTKPSKPVSKAALRKQISAESDSDSETESSGSEDELEKVHERIRKRREENEKKRTLDNLRAPVICVLGHVDTGKTKILDKLRRTNVQDGEAGGITQQIGATNVPLDAIREQTKIVKGFSDVNIKVPGLLIIDTPGHESFSNLRSRGSSLCDLAILVIDIMHGLEPQTIESINLLKAKKTPFVVALNKVDRLFEWQSNAKRDIRDVLKSQKANTQLEFKQRTDSSLLQLAEQGLNAKLFFENPDPKSYISVVPTSAISGDGMSNLIALIVELNQNLLAKRLQYSEELQATVLEVKAITGHGTTIDVILINGSLRVGDEIVLAGFDGPIVTQVRALLMPKPMKELRVKNEYSEPREVRAAQGVKIAAKDLEKAIAGLNLQVVRHPDEVDILKEEVSGELKSALRTIKLQERGVYVQASTLGSLEALLEFLKTSEIPYSNVRIGPVAKRDVMKASIMLEHDSQYAVILAFDVKIERDAQEMADSVGVKIFHADIIYHLFDKFIKYRDELKQKRRDEFKNIAVFPCKFRILPQFVFNSRDPIVCGVMIEAGVLKEGTPICVPSKDFLEIGVVTTIEINHKQMDLAKKGQEVCVKIESTGGDAPKMFGRHFDHTDMLVSKISRQSIDACKDYFREDLTKADWQLMIELKKQFQIL